jgi:hypothetical protein
VQKAGDERYQTVLYCVNGGYGVVGSLGELVYVCLGEEFIVCWIVFTFDSL